MRCLERLDHRRALWQKGEALATETARLQHEARDDDRERRGLLEARQA